jgi:hypothetical protein
MPNLTPEQPFMPFVSQFGNDEFWRETVPFYEGISTAQFLSWNWSVS